jgi:hypothetical protein
MRRLGSLVMRAADETRVPAGAALAVDRDLFSSRVTEAIASHPLISIRRGEVTSIPSGADGPVIIATGPLTSDALSAEIAALVGSKHLYFYDAISPIVLSESIDRTKVFRAPLGPQPRGSVSIGRRSDLRWPQNRARRPSARGGEISLTPVAACGVDDGKGTISTVRSRRTSTSASTPR